MKHTLIKNCKMDWDEEMHSFTFVTGGDSMTALDSLKDLMGSLNKLYAHIIEQGGINGELPDEIKVVGGCNWTQVEG